RWVAAKGRGMFDENGRCVRMLGTAIDITARKRTEEQLRELNETLERRVEEQIAERLKTEDALRQAQKMEAVGQLTGGIAHDFNNVLGAVVGGFELIRRKPGDADRVLRHAEAGLRAAERGTRLTGQLLAFSRAQQLEMKSLRPSDLILGMREMLLHALRPMVRLDLRLDEGDTRVMADPTQLEMAVLNLAINARDSMPEGGTTTFSTGMRRIDGDAELAPGLYVELAVADTGSGMDAAVAARAFEPFFTTKGVGKGTGLGLSQVYGIARQAGGTVRLESRLGAGTTVRILLPTTAIGSQDEAPASLQDGGAAERTLSVLVVDDDANLRGVLVETLDSLGYRVLEAEDGPAGLAVLERELPDLLMLDFAMPGMNGAEVARHALARHPDLPIMFATGYADIAAINEVVGPQALVLRKPFRVSELQAMLAMALQQKRSA
ncbi:MAG TPA: response regulator, partial [Pseudoxanthomonas sp.]|nr:response regulator [Pseudoxanthomonas sp.]